MLKSLVALQYLVQSTKYKSKRLTMFENHMDTSILFKFTNKRTASKRTYKRIDTSFVFS